jgi:hypothetical protein
VLERIAAESRRTTAIPVVHQPWLYVAALLVLSLSLAWVILFPDRETSLIVEAVWDHSQAVPLERLCDVVSPDPAVVKQSLTANLDSRRCHPEPQSSGTSLQTEPGSGYPLRLASCRPDPCGEGLVDQRVSSLRMARC